MSSDGKSASTSPAPQVAKKRSGKGKKQPVAPTAEMDESFSESEEEVQPQRRLARRQQNFQQDGMVPFGQGPMNGMADSTNQTMGGVANTALQQQGKGGGKDTLKLRLDLNLDIEITLKAKIHGDLELALL